MKSLMIGAKDIPDTKWTNCLILLMRYVERSGIAKNTKIHSTCKKSIFSWFGILFFKLTYNVVKLSMHSIINPESLASQAIQK